MSEDNHMNVTSVEIFQLLYSIKNRTESVISWVANVVCNERRHVQTGVNKQFLTYKIREKVVSRIHSRRVPLTTAKKKLGNICKKGNHCNLYSQGDIGNNGKSRNVSNLTKVTIIRTMIKLVMVATIVTIGTDACNHGTHKNIAH